SSIGQTATVLRRGASIAGAGSAGLVSLCPSASSSSVSTPTSSNILATSSPCLSSSSGPGTTSSGPTATTTAISSTAGNSSAGGAGNAGAFTVALACHRLSPAISSNAALTSSSSSSGVSTIFTTPHQQQSLFASSGTSGRISCSSSSLHVEPCTSGGSGVTGIGINGNGLISLPITGQPGGASLSQIIRPRQPAVYALQHSCYW
ncbi:unnamed protein product, partial [Protopolystoma xenopodis]